MLPVAFDNRGGLAGTERSGEAGLLLCAAGLYNACHVCQSLSWFHLILKQNLKCVVGCVSVDFGDWFRPLPGQKARVPFSFFAPPNPPRPSLQWPDGWWWWGVGEKSRGRLLQWSQVSGWWLRWDTWHAPERFDQWGALLGGSGYVA